jgi:hypothetical protein
MKCAHYLGLLCLLILQACSYNTTIPVLKVPTNKNEMNLGAAANIGTGVAGLQAVGSYNIAPKFGINSAASVQAGQTHYSYHTEFGIHYNRSTEKGNLMFSPAFGTGRGYFSGYGDLARESISFLYYAYSLRFQYESNKHKRGFSSKVSVLTTDAARQSHGAAYPTKSSEINFSLDNTFYWRLKENKHHSCYLYTTASLNSLTSVIPGSISIGACYNFSTHFQSKKPKE